MGRSNAPFPWPGGKSRIAAQVWERLGEVHSYSEPCAGGLGVLLGNPNGPAANEVVADTDGFICNFWRAVAANPVGVARHADYPSFHQDLTARHRWLMRWAETSSARLSEDPDWFDAQAAGWWLWGISLWVGKGWCAGEPNEQRPAIHSEGGVGVAAQRRQLSGEVGSGERIEARMMALARRLSRVSTLNADWSAAVTPRVLDSNGLGRTVGVFLDPPYRRDTGRTDGLYASDAAGDPAVESYEWALEHGERYRVVYCCRVGDFPVPDGWDSIEASFKGVHRKSGKPPDLVMFSPACLPASGGLL